MRLLKYEDDGRLTIASFNDDTIPPYAILSHTWGADAEEVTFADLAKGGGKHKPGYKRIPGYKKIRFCGEQAQQDGLQYFWVDTCCIDKTDKAELSLAIRSMFRWYQNATKCYVYLSDVSTRKRKADSISTEITWEPAFRSSRWFTRGWTLQELLAPSIVEFFSQEWKRLGDKISVKSLIKKITGIPCEALDGAPLSQFSVDERLRWKGDRETKREEDAWYSLSGIFDVEIAPAYSEGAASAFKRLKEEINKLEICIRDIRHTDPRHDKKRIEDTKGGLLADSYRWVLDNTTFQRWQQDPQSRLLWVKGDPGKGKTMLLCGIIDELRSALPKNVLLAYFFCQATDSRINSATAVLRGLLYMLVSQQPSLLSHVRTKHDHAGKTLFEDANAWVALSEIFVDVLRDPGLSTTYLIIDALDECVSDLPKLLTFVAKQSSASSRVKWIVSSRNWPYIEAQLERAGHKVRLSLELNAKSVAVAVDIFIQRKVDRLAQEKQYKAEVRSAVLQHLTSNANGTFLWVALVCQDLKATPRWNALKKLALFPPGLDALYKRMIQQISETDGAEICQQVLASTSVLYRPVTILELSALVQSLDGLGDDLKSVRDIVGLCGSFLTLQGETVYFVHQSAKDYLLVNAANKVFPAGVEVVHHALFARSLLIMSKSLQRDMYGLRMPGYPIEEVQRLSHDPLASSRYSCVYWVDHLRDSDLMSSGTHMEDLEDDGVIHFFLKEKYLYWLEALSLCRSIPKGVISMANLRSLIQGASANSLAALVYDAYRFVMINKVAIEGSPLQAYASAMVFSPTNSLIKKLFQHEEPNWVTIRPTVDDEWSACLQTLEGHNAAVNSVTFSHDSTRLASGSHSGIVKIWNTSNGECLLTIEGHSGPVMCVVFSHKSTRLASGSNDSTIKMWDTSSGACLQEFRGHDSLVWSVVFIHNSSQLASGSYDETIKVWDASSGACLQTLEAHSSITSVAISHDSTKLASASGDGFIELWDTSSGACLQTLEGDCYEVSSVAFSHDSAWLASVGYSTVKIWDASNGMCLQTFEARSTSLQSVAFSHDSTRLLLGSEDSTVEMWDVSNYAYLQAFNGHSSAVRSVVFSHDSTYLASASCDETIKIWDARSGGCLQTSEGHGSEVTSVAFSSDSIWLASGSDDETIKIWDTRSGACLRTFEGNRDEVMSVAFSHDSSRLASVGHSTVKIWDPSNGACLQMLTGHSGAVLFVTFSQNPTLLASASNDNTIKIWDTNSSACLQTLEGHSGCVMSVSFSHDSTQLASASEDHSVKIWDINSGACLQTLKGHSSYVRAVVFLHDSTKLASASCDNTVKIWDASSGTCLQTLCTGQNIRKLFFDSTSFCLHTDKGSIAVDDSVIASTTEFAGYDDCQYVGVGISPDGVWITYDDHNMLWVPSEYRSSCSSVCGCMIGVGVGFGRVWMCIINAEHIGEMM